MTPQKQLDQFPLSAQRTIDSTGNGLSSPYMTTEEASKYIRKSESWLLKQSDIPYLRGVPNLYSRKDLDSWFERHKFNPRAA
jgi:hypothetical protein